MLYAPVTKAGGNSRFKIQPNELMQLLDASLEDGFVRALKRSKKPLASNVFVMRHGGNECRLSHKGFCGTGYQPFNVQRQDAGMSPTDYGEPRQNPYSHQQAAILSKLSSILSGEGFDEGRWEDRCFCFIALLH